MLESNHLFVRSALLTILGDFFSYQVDSWTLLCNCFNKFESNRKMSSCSDSESFEQVFQASFRSSSPSQSPFTSTLHIAISVNPHAYHTNFPLSLETSSVQTSRFSYQGPVYANTSAVMQQEDSSFEQHEQRESNSSSSFGEFELEPNLDMQESQEHESPFFSAVEHQGLSWQQIKIIPTMVWSQIHQKLNRGEKCAVCLQAYQVGGTLRVMPCLHRYHMQCLDEWLQMRANCPNCRTAVDAM